MKVVQLATLVALVLLPFGGIAAEASEAPEEIIVTGRQPGPPLWKVSNGDKVLWIFPAPDWVPKDMVWDSARVARVIAESQEILEGFELRAGAPASVMLNPINLVRVNRLGDRLQRNPDGGTLQDTLPQDLYARFAALHTRYFAGNTEILEMRPYFAGQAMKSIILRREGLVPGNDILKTIRQLTRRNRGIERTEIAVRVDMGSNYGEFAERYESWVESLPPAQEQACFEQQVRHMEEDIGAMKSSANSWAQGYVDEFRDAPLLQFWQSTGSNACDDLWMGNSSSERQTLANIISRLKQTWLAAADKALMTNASTFAMLPVTELLAEDGLLSELEAKGYEVKEP